jgi:hypothetical protein
MATIHPLAGRKNGGLFDMRTKEGRTLKSIVDGLADELGLEQSALSPVQAAALQRSAELELLATESRHRALFGDATALGECVRLERLSDASRKRLGLSAGRSKPTGPSLAEYLKQKQAAAS